jgi:hypothetical protein
MAQKTIQKKSLGRFENCRVVEIGDKKYGECLQQGPVRCSYAVPFGYCFLCKNPRVCEIIENTKKVQARAGVFN